MASGASEDEQLAQFQSITGADSEQAKFFLDSAQGQLEMALTAFFDGETEMESSSAGLGSQTAASQPPTVPSGDRKEKSSSSSSTRRGAGASSNIHSLSHASSDDDDDEDKDSGQAFYAGGSSTSGQQIIGPPKKGHDFVKEMFKRARDQGAEVEDDESSSSGHGRRGPNSFGGTGFKLGSNESDSEVVPSMSKPKEEEREFTLKMWHDGFSLDNGPLRAYDDPTNREFLSSIMKGRVPLELIREARGGEVNIKMEDHKHEDYVKPQAAAKPFQGAGHVLGSVLPDMEVTPPVEPKAPQAAEAAIKEEVKVDDSQPTTSLQVRLSNGSRLVVKLNHTHTVGDLRRAIIAAHPEYTSLTFSLLTTFPNKELTNDADTLTDAELLGAAILLRPK
uniref:NSFL1 cofactor p47 n=1 Tax=Caligus clemensi TaxID=344056 RepID=C1C094_CALCM|nr:NSFL1 cofactor p47 [Caligus clemensi]